MKNKCGKPERADRTKQLQALREGDANFMNGHVIENVRQGDARHCRDDQNKIHLYAGMKWSFDLTKSESQRQQERRSDETDDAETADGTKLGRWAFDQDAVERPAKCGGEGDEQPSEGNMSILRAGLKPDYSESSDKAEQRADLELRLPDHVPLFWKKHEREQCGEDHGGARKDRINARAHVKERHHLGDLVNDVWNAWQETNGNRLHVDLRSATTSSTQEKRHDCQARDRVAIKILRPDVVIAIEEELKERRERPDDDGGENRGIASGETLRVAAGSTEPFWHRLKSFNLLASRRLFGQKSKRRRNMKITNSPMLSILLAPILSAMLISPSSAKTRGGGEGEAEVHQKKGIELMDAKHFDQAAEEFGKMTAVAPNDVRGYHNRGMAHLAGAEAADANRDTTGAETRYAAAIADFSKEIELAPKNEAGYAGRGQAEFMQRQYDAALADLNKALELKPDDGFALKFRGFAEIGLFQWDKAVADFTAAIQKNPDDPQNYDRRAWAYRNMKNYDGAIADYTVLLDKNPNDAETLAKRGYTYSLMQQYEKAIADYEQVLKLNPNDIDTPQRLQYARAMLAAANAPPPTPATPTPTPAPSLLTPVNIVIAVVVLIIIAIVVRLATRGKAEPTSSRIR